MNQTATNTTLKAATSLDVVPPKQQIRKRMSLLEIQKDIRERSKSPTPRKHNSCVGKDNFDLGCGFEMGRNTGAGVRT